MRRKLTKELLEPIVADSHCTSEVMRRLGYKTYMGSAHAHLSKRFRDFGIPTDHFDSWKHARDPRPWIRRTAASVLVKRTTGNRQHGWILKRALLEVGVKHACYRCGIDEWLGERLTLEVDHVDGDVLNDEQDNLRLACPNCHSITPTFGNRIR